MARKTAYGKAHMTLIKPTTKKEIIKQKTWQHLFNNKDKAFTVCELAKEFETSDRKTISEALEELGNETIIEKSKKYNVYKTGRYYQVFDDEEYKNRLKCKKSMYDLINEEAHTLNNHKMWTEKCAKSIPCEVIFYPIEKRKQYFNMITNSLHKLFGDYIIATLEGEKDDRNGIFIILKPHKDIKSIISYIEQLYDLSANQ